MAEDNAFAPPEEQGGQYKKDDLSLPECQRLLNYFDPMVKAAPWGIASGISMVIFMGVLLRQMLAFEVMQALLGIIPMVAAVFLSYAFVNIKRGAKRASSVQITKGCKQLKISMMIFAVLILLYIGLMVYLLVSVRRMM